MSLITIFIYHRVSQPALLQESRSKLRRRFVLDGGSQVACCRQHVSHMPIFFQLEVNIMNHPGYVIIVSRIEHKNQVFFFSLSLYYMMLEILCNLWTA